MGSAEAQMPAPEKPNSAAAAKPAEAKPQESAAPKAPASQAQAAAAKPAIAHLAWSGATLLLGVLSLFVAMSFSIVPLLLRVKPINDRAFALFAIAGVLLLITGGVGLYRAVYMLPPVHDDDPEPARSVTLFGRHLVGIGFALLADALATT